MADKGKQKGAGKLGGQKESRGIDEDGEFAEESAFSTEHGASGNREQQKFGVLLTVIDGQQCERSDGRQGQARIRAREAGSQRGEDP